MHPTRAIARRAVFHAEPRRKSQIERRTLEDEGGFSSESAISASNESSFALAKVFFCIEDNLLLSSVQTTKSPKVFVYQEMFHKMSTVFTSSGF